MNNSKEGFENEYDLKSLGKGVKGKYFEQYQQGTNVVVIDPELSKAFPNARAVNDALRKALGNKKKLHHKAMIRDLKSSGFVSTF